MIKELKNLYNKKKKLFYRNVKKKCKFCKVNR